MSETERALEWTRQHCRLIVDARGPHTRAAYLAVWAFEYPDAQVKDVGQAIAADLAETGGTDLGALLDRLNSILYSDHGGASVRIAPDGSAWHLDAVPPAVVRDCWMED